MTKSLDRRPKVVQSRNRSAPIDHAVPIERVSCPREIEETRTELTVHPLETDAS